jgi:hypothetical protein
MFLPAGLAATMGLPVQIPGVHGLQPPITAVAATANTDENDLSKSFFTQTSYCERLSKLSAID